MVTKGRYEMLKALMPIVNTVVKQTFVFYPPGFPASQYQYHDKWNERTIRQVFEFFSIYLLRENKFKWGQIVRTMRDAFIGGTDCHLDFHAAGGSNVPRMQTIASNPLISYLSDNKMQFTIPYEQLRSLFSDMNVLLTSLYTFEGREISSSRFSNDYRLDFDALWGEFDGKLRTIYTNLYKVLSSIERKDKSKPFHVKFYTESGLGFQLDSKLDKGTYTATSLDFVNSEFKFDPSRPDEVHRAVQSIVLYTFFLPGTVACVYEDYRNMIFGLDMTQTYTPEEMREVSLTSRFKSPSSKLFVPQDDFAALKNSLFKPGEIPWFLLFNPPKTDGSGELLPHLVTDKKMRKQMFQYYVFKYMKSVIEEGHGLHIEDLTVNQYITMNNIYVNPYTIIWDALRRD